MEKFTTHKGIACPLEHANIDTDQIIPKQFLLTTSKLGLGKYAFFHLRYDDDVGEVFNMEFNLNKKEYEHTSILVSFENFGSGSSREHAPWALMDYGIRAIIAPSFADIFKNNALGNGLLTVELQKTDVEWIIEHLKVAKDKQMEISLVEKRVSFQGRSFHFELESFHTNCLLNGLDSIDLTLQHRDKIKEHERHSQSFMVPPSPTCV